MCVPRAALQGRDKVVVAPTLNDAVACGVFEAYNCKDQAIRQVSLRAFSRDGARRQDRVDVFTASFNRAPPAKVTDRVCRQYGYPTSARDEDLRDHCPYAVLDRLQIREYHLSRKGERCNLRAISRVAHRRRKSTRTKLLRYRALRNVSARQVCFVRSEPSFAFLCRSTRVLCITVEEGLIRLPGFFLRYRAKRRHFCFLLSSYVVFCVLRLDAECGEGRRRADERRFRYFRLWSVA